MFIVLFSILSSLAHNGARNYQECLEVNFKPKSCWEAKQFNKGGKFLCKIQGKGFDDKGCVK